MCVRLPPTEGHFLIKTVYTGPCDTETPQFCFSVRWVVNLVQLQNGSHTMYTQDVRDTRQWERCFCYCSRAPCSTVCCV